MRFCGCSEGEGSLQTLRSQIFCLHKRLLSLDIPRYILDDKKTLGPPEKNSHLYEVTHINRAYSINNGV